MSCRCRRAHALFRCAALLAVVGAPATAQSDELPAYAGRDAPT